ncbi:putative plasma kallikrein-like [Apostichopus japonicus]|uniref:Putative plasma kallikrein-like n=1 Tax=Stichopus japonicus TaxID=307972 RepID=A0A2G8KRB7_STIJA|nr:putative plasma kallikrein-like [Apostichopus japonicus]
MKSKTTCHTSGSGYLSDPFALSSPNYPLRYSTNIDIVWVFEAMSGQSLTFHCESFHTEEIYDTVTIGNGLNPNQGSIREFSGTSCYDVTSDGNQMWIKFHSDYSETAKGFEGKVAIAVPRADLCGYNNEVANTRIVGGRDTVIERWPWQILLIEIDDDHKYQKCGGTLITPRHVLTAAHCFDSNDSPDKHLVALAKNTTGYSLNEIKRKVIDIAVHEGFADDNTYKNDIAILTLESEVTVPRSREDLDGDNPVNTACFDYGGDWNEESECFVTGYGVVDVVTDETADKLQEAEIIYLSADACLDNTNHSMPYILPTMICGASPSGNVVKDSCQGDSGGPLVCRSKLDT